MHWSKNVKGHGTEIPEQVGGKYKVDKTTKKRQGVWNYHQNVGEKIRMHRKWRHQSKSKKMEVNRAGRIVKFTITTWEKNEMRHRKRGQQSKSGHMINEAQETGEPPHHWGRNECKLSEQRENGDTMGEGGTCHRKRGKGEHAPGREKKG